MKDHLWDRFNEKELYAIILLDNKKPSLSRLRSGMTKFAGQPFRRKNGILSAPYRVTFGLIQGIMAVKGLEIEEEGVFDLYDEVALKKMSTVFLDGMSISGLGYSPLWLLAIVNELMDGQQNFDQIIQEELKKVGLLSADETYDTIIDLLESLYDHPYMDTNLFNHQTIGKLKDDFLKLGSYDRAKLDSMQVKLMNLWDKMHRIGKYENFSVNRINGIISLEVVRRLDMKNLPANKATLVALFDHFDDLVYDAMADAINNFSDRGKKHYLFSNIKPFIGYYLEKDRSSRG